MKTNTIFHASRIEWHGSLPMKNRQSFQWIFFISDNERSFGEHPPIFYCWKNNMLKFEYIVEKRFFIIDFDLLEERECLTFLMYVLWLDWYLQWNHTPHLLIRSYLRNKRVLTIFSLFCFFFVVEFILQYSIRSKSIKQRISFEFWIRIYWKVFLCIELFVGIHLLILKVHYRLKWIKHKRISRTHHFKEIIKR